MKKSKILCIMAAVCVFMTLSVMMISANAKSVYNTTMTVKTAAYVYSRKTATAPYRTGYLTYGEEFTVTDLTDEWATVIYEGKTRYIKSNNIEYKQILILKNKASVSSVAAKSTSSTFRGYVNCGDIVYDLGIVDNGGTKYRRCLFPVTYTSSGKVKSRSVVGYLPSYYTTEKTEEKIVNGGTKLYYYAYLDESASYKKAVAMTVKTGVRVKYVGENRTWAKIIYNNNIYFISKKKLSDYTLKATAVKTVMREDVMSNSPVIKNIYWNSKITVLKSFRVNGYDCHLCKYGSYVGFVPAGEDYFGSNDIRYTKVPTTLYRNSYEASGVATPLHAEEMLKTYYSNGTWVNAKYGSKTGYILASKLKMRKYSVNTAYYTSGYNIYSNKAAGRYSGTVELVALKPSVYAYVKTADGRYIYIKAVALSSYYGVTMYTEKSNVKLYNSASNYSSYVILPRWAYVTYYEDYLINSDGVWMKVRYNGNIYYICQKSGRDLLAM